MKQETSTLQRFVKLLKVYSLDSVDLKIIAFAQDKWNKEMLELLTF